RSTHLLRIAEGFDPQQLLLQRAEEALDTPIALGRSHESWARLDAEKGKLGLKVIADVLAAMIMAHSQTTRNALGVAFESITDRLANGFERLEASRLLGRVTANAFRGAVIDRREDGHQAFVGRPDSGRVRAPHDIGTLGHDRAIVDARTEDALGARGSQEVCDSHQPQHTRLGCPHTCKSEARPDLAMPFADEWRGRQHAPDPIRELLVVQGSLWSTAGDRERRLL